MDQCLRWSFGVRAEVFDEPDGSVRIISQESNGYVAASAQESTNGAGDMVVIDTEVLLSSARLRASAYGANALLGYEQGVVVFNGHSVVATECHPSIVCTGLLRVFGEAYEVFGITRMTVRPQVGAAIPNAGLELQGRLDEAAARASFFISACRLAGRWIGAQSLLIRLDTRLADGATTARTSLVFVEVGERLPQETFGAVAAIKEGNGGHGMLLPMSCGIIPRCGIGIWHVGSEF